MARKVAAPPVPRDTATKSIIEDWRCGEHATHGDCPWCGGSGTYARAIATPDGNVACGYCLGTGNRAERPSAAR